MVPILLIHGFGGGHKQFKPIINFLKKYGFNKFYEFTYKEKWGEVSLGSISRELSKFIRKNVMEKSINIIGISQGGLIARHYIQNFNKKKIKKCITICTPHKGSLMAYLTSIDGFLDLRPNSPFLKKLNHKVSNTKFYSVFTPFDLMVFPGFNARLENAKNKMVFSFLHPLSFWCKPTLLFILESLREK